MSVAAGISLTGCLSGGADNGVRRQSPDDTWSALLTRIARHHLIKPAVEILFHPQPAARRRAPGRVRRGGHQRSAGCTQLTDQRVGTDPQSHCVMLAGDPVWQSVLVWH